MRVRSYSPCLLFLLLLGCGARGPARSTAPAGAAPLLARIPADTAFHLVTYAPIGRLGLDHLIATAAAFAADRRAAETPSAALDALATLLAGHASHDGFARLGVGPDARVALYAVEGAVVLRVEPIDAEAMRAFLSEYDGAVRAIGGNALAVVEDARRTMLRFDDGPLALVAAAGERSLVFVAGPAATVGRALPVALGDAAPEQSLADGDPAAARAAALGMPRPDVVARVDPPALVTAARAWGLPDACGGELARLLAVVPRIVGALDLVEGVERRELVHVQLRPDVAERVRAVVRPLPARAAPADEAVALSIGLDLQAAGELIADGARAMADEARACPLLVSLRPAFRNVARLAEGVLPAFARGVHGGTLALRTAGDRGAPAVVVLARDAPALVRAGTDAFRDRDGEALAPDGRARDLAGWEPLLRGLGLEGVAGALAPDRLALVFGPDRMTRAEQLLAAPLTDDGDLLRLRAIGDPAARLESLLPGASDDMRRLRWALTDARADPDIEVRAALTATTAGLTWMGHRRATRRPALLFAEPIRSRAGALRGWLARACEDWRFSRAPLAPDVALVTVDAAPARARQVPWVTVLTREGAGFSGEPGPPRDDRWLDRHLGEAAGSLRMAAEAGLVPGVVDFLAVAPDVELARIREVLDAYRAAGFESVVLMARPRHPTPPPPPDREAFEATRTALGGADPVAVRARAEAADEALRAECPRGAAGVRDLFDGRTYFTCPEMAATVAPLLATCDALDTVDRALSVLAAIRSRGVPFAGHEIALDAELPLPLRGDGPWRDAAPALFR